jgi:D-alanyl-lipoteichoic acid acyltransferase DltB (MBOAT superfamily)
MSLVMAEQNKPRNRKNHVIVIQAVNSLQIVHYKIVNTKHSQLQTDPVTEMPIIYPGVSTMLFSYNACIKLPFIIESF